MPPFFCETSILPSKATVRKKPSIINSIANYFKNRATSGFVEGLNNKIKVVKRRCYGFFKTESLFQRLMIDLRGYKMLGI